MLLEVSERQDKVQAEVRADASPPVDLYMVRTPRFRLALFLPRRSLELCSRTEVDHFARFIRKMRRNRYGVIRWVGRVTRLAHRYYQKLEDQIDPLERMIKALNCPTSFRVLHVPGIDAEARFRDLLRGQIVKHSAWLVVDGVLTVIAAMFFWVLVPIPGPNIFLYYPALRLVSHYRAKRGARRVLNDTGITFEARPELAAVERRVEGRGSEVSDETDLGDRIEGLDEFLKRMA